MGKVYIYGKAHLLGGLVCVFKLDNNGEFNQRSC